MKIPAIHPGDKIPATGLYRVKKGTRIITAAKVRKMEGNRSGRRSGR